MSMSIRSKVNRVIESCKYREQMETAIKFLELACKNTDAFKREPFSCSYTPHPSYYLTEQAHIKMANLPSIAEKELH